MELIVILLALLTLANGGLIVWIYWKLIPRRDVQMKQLYIAVSELLEMHKNPRDTGFGTEKVERLLEDVKTMLTVINDRDRTIMTLFGERQDSDR